MTKYLKSNQGKWIECEGYEKKIILTEKDLNCKGSLLQVIKINPKTKIEPHFHKKMTEVFFILKGEAVIFIEGKNYRLKPGDTLVCHPNEVHGAKNDSNEEFEYLVFKTNVEKDDSFWIK
jgi:quercetin dioxygenase-like cupin family protein